MCKFASLHCFHTFTAVSLLDPVAKLVQADEQRGTALREEDGCLLCVSAAAMQMAHGAFQSCSKASRL